MANKGLHSKMRIIHRYLGFFLAGIMMVYALSGMTLIFRDTDAFKQTKQVQKKVDPGLNQGQLGQALRIRGLKIEKKEGDLVLFKQGSYNQATGEAVYVEKKLPFILEKITHFHKAKTGDTLYYFNLFFGLSLLFFAISSFWMFMPKTSIFKKGMYFTLAGLVLALLLVFV